MIAISLTRAIEEMVGMFFKRQSIKTCFVCKSRSIATKLYLDIYQEIQRYYNHHSVPLSIYYHKSEEIKNLYQNSNIFLYTEEENGFLTSKCFDLVLIDTKIDSKFHDEIRLSLRQNSMIPSEKQIQFFDIEQDKVWFEGEYKMRCLEDVLDKMSIDYHFNDTKICTDWVRKQAEPYVKRKQMDAYDQYLTSKYVLKMVKNIDDAIYKELFTKDKREDEEPMSNFAINVEVGKIRVPAITDIEIVVPDKVVKVSFTDGTDMKMVCHEEDTFDLRRCLFIAIAKKLYKDRYTWEGIEHKATELSYLKSVTKVVDKAMKDYKNKIKEAEKEAKEIADKKRAAENQKIKHAKYIKRRDERRQKEKDEQERQKFEYDVAVQVEAARRIKEEEVKMYYGCNCDSECSCDHNSEWDGK